MTVFFTELFFLLTILFFIHEVRCLFNPMKRINDAIKYTNRTDKLGGDGCLYLVMILFYFIWVLIGFSMATQWYSFGFIILLGLIGYGLMNLSKNLKYKSVIMVFDSLISLVILSYIYFNHFHPEIIEMLIK